MLFNTTDSSSDDAPVKCMPAPALSPTTGGFREEYAPPRGIARKTRALVVHFGYTSPPWDIEPGFVFKNHCCVLLLDTSMH